MTGVPVYARLPVADFSKQVLASPHANLAVLLVSAMGWNDVGEPGRIMATRRLIGSSQVPAAAG
jgi:hypothetical protein